MFEDSPDSQAKARLRAQINDNLRRVYEETLQEDIPDRFTVLLQQLRAKNGAGEGNNA